MSSHMDAPTLCPMCDGKGCEDCLQLGFMPPISQAEKDRVQQLFYKKLAERYPDHPWIKKGDQ